MAFKKGQSGNPNGRPPGIKNKFSRDLKETLRTTWQELQNKPETSLLELAKEKPLWFYELMKGCFPKDLFIHGDIDVNSMSKEELESRLWELLDGLGVVQGAEGPGEDQ